MALLNDKDRQVVRDHLEKSLFSPVTLLYFTQEMACQFCAETEELLHEVASLSNKIKFNVYSFVTDQDVAKEYGIDKVLATVVMSDVDYGVRFFGIPSGHEFVSLIEAIVDVSQGTSDLAEETREALKEVMEPVHMQVYITPTCPYCPRAVRLAHSLAVASDWIRADMVEAVEFPQLSNKYQVYGVPKTIINEETSVVGAVPEPALVAGVLQAVGIMTPEEVEELMEDLGAQAKTLGSREWTQDKA
ncbi:MAG: thioredoxin family protein [Chloroflexota bacterium]|nr:thioredoxin family protein [Chloroflexota bacterium]